MKIRACTLAAAGLVLGGAAAARPESDGALRVEGPSLVFVAPAGARGDAIREQHARLKEVLERRRIKAVLTEPALLRLGEGGLLGGRLRQVDFRKTPAFHGTLVFAEDRDPQIRQTLEADADLLARVEAYMKKKGR
jgi:hypothetical protein